MHIPLYHIYIYIYIYIHITSLYYAVLHTSRYPYLNIYTMCPYIDTYTNVPTTLG